MEFVFLTRRGPRALKHSAARRSKTSNSRSEVFIFRVATLRFDAMAPSHPQEYIDRPLQSQAA